jgi:hypothetical protein
MYGIALRSIFHIHHFLIVIKKKKKINNVKERYSYDIIARSCWHVLT